MPLHTQHRSGRRLALVLVVLLAALTAGCGFAVTPSPSVIAPRVGPPERILVPSCGNDLGAGATIAFDPQIPHNLQAVLGFSPMLPTRLPTPLTWNIAVITGQRWSQGPTPFFHAGYGVWFTRPYHAYALHTVVALDETTAPLTPTSDITVSTPPLAIADHSTTDISGHPAAVYHLRSGTDGVGARMTALLWNVDGVWLRLTAMQSGRYTLFPDQSTQDAYMDDVMAWPEADDAALMLIARSVKRYTGCNSPA